MPELAASSFISSKVKLTHFSLTKFILPQSSCRSSS